MNEISQDQKALLLNSNVKNYGGLEKHSSIEINNKSAFLVKENTLYKDTDIYTRGIVHQNHVKTHIQKAKEEKARKELKNCTFKPSINNRNIA